VRALRDFLLAPPEAAAFEPSPPLPGAATGRRRRGGARAAAPATRRVPRAVAVLCAGEDARAVGVAAAVLLARRGRTGCGLALVWTASPHRGGESGGRAGRGARRLAAALTARDIAASARGRVVQVALPAAPEDAIAVARRAAATAGDVPVVLVVGGPRDAAFDAVLADQDRLLVLTRPAAEEAVTALALAGLPGAGVAQTVALGPAARALAAAGLGVPAALRRALAPVLDDDEP